MAKHAVLACLLLVGLPATDGHAYVYWPKSRNLLAAPHIAHCFNVPGPAVAYNSVHNAGGKAAAGDFAKGMCGYFGGYQPTSDLMQDGIAHKAAGSAVASYKQGGQVTFTIVNNAEHGGHYEFRLCKRRLDASLGSREDAAKCLDEHFLGRFCVPQCGCDSDTCRSNPEHNDPNDPLFAHGPPLHLQQGAHEVTVTLPPDVYCETCTVQWFWHTAWGEQFWNCVDIGIESTGGTVPMPTPPPLLSTLPTTTSINTGGGVECLWTSPPGRTVTRAARNEKVGRKCWDFTVPGGTTVYYQAKSDIYIVWNADACCLNAASPFGSSLGSDANIVAFTTGASGGSFGFCECTAWDPNSPDTSCAGQATAENMICPVKGMGMAGMCLDNSPLSTRPAVCGGSPPVSTTAPPTGSCGADWGGCLSSRCCSGTGFTCYEMDASYAECRSDACPNDWSCKVLGGSSTTPVPTTPAPTPAPGPCSGAWQQCGGQDFVGYTCCESGSYCKFSNAWYSQCVPGTAPAPVTPAPATTPSPTPLPVVTPAPTPTPAATTPEPEPEAPEPEPEAPEPEPEAPEPEPETEPAPEPEASGCARFCGLKDLGSKKCGSLDGDQEACSKSFVTRSGVTVPCYWTGCGCVANAEELELCPSLTSTCSKAPTNMPTVAPTLAPALAPTVAPTPQPATTSVPTTTRAPTPEPATTPAPTQAPTQAPTTMPTRAPTPQPATTPAPTPLPAISPAPTLAPTPAPSQGPCSGNWQQCGGQNFAGYTCCEVGLYCKFSNDWYSQCVPGPAPAPVNPAPTTTKMPTPATTPMPSSPTPAPGPTPTWDGLNMKMTHYWDCNGQGCDAATLQPWDLNKFVSPPGYGPQDPADFGGALYGESMWLTGAASDALSKLMGNDDGCCGADLNDGGVGGCGKCALVENPDALHSNWTALVMKKNRCPPHSPGCGAGEPHFDVAAPGFDNLQYSTANVCGMRPGTGFTTQKQSAAAGSWWTECQNTADCQHLCDALPADFQKGCKLFASWGWKRGDPNRVKYKAVPCPSEFVKHVSGLFGASGVLLETSSAPVMMQTMSIKEKPRKRNAFLARYVSATALMQLEQKRGSRVPRTAALKDDLEL